MPRKGTILSPAAAERQAAAAAEWHAKHYENLSVPLRKGKRDAYKELASKRGTSVSRLIQDYLDGLCAEEGIIADRTTGRET